MDNLRVYGNEDKAHDFIESVKPGKFLFSLVISYTQTCEVPGITFAGSSKDMIQFTSPADAEYLHYGYCKTIDGLPVTPDGKPSPALITKTALESSSIPHLVINAGSKVPPQLPYVHTGLIPGRNISVESAMDDSYVAQAVDYGRIVGRSLASLTDCLIIGESIPGGTTTALAVLRGLGFDAKVSSSMPDNPVDLKNQIVNSALSRMKTESNPFRVMANVGDPMLAFVTGMLSSASDNSKVLLAGGTQMAAVLALASKIGFNDDNVAVGTTSYIVDDETASFRKTVTEISDVPTIAIDPEFSNSTISGAKIFL